MKTIIKKLPLVVLFLCSFENTFAQGTGTMIPAINTDNVITTPESYLLSNAVIDYSSFCPISAPCYSTDKQLRAMITDNGSLNNAFIISDGVSSATLPMPSFLPGYSGGSNEVILGDNINNLGDYYAAVIYIQGNTSPPYDQNVFLALYDIKNVGTGSLAGSLFGTYQITNSNIVTGLPRIDVIAEYHNLWPTSGIQHPKCDAFAMVWEEYNSITNTRSVYTATETLSSPTSFPTSVDVYNYTSVSTTPELLPDIAGIQRASGSSIQNWGLITFSVGSSTLLESEINYSSPPPTPPPPTNTFSASYRFGQFPRIDALDDYLINSSTSIMQWGITITDFSYSPIATVLYTNLSSTATNLSSPINVSDGDAWLPSITVGPGSGYTVGFNALNSNNVYLENIDWTTGQPSSFPYNNYYQVNQLPAASLVPYISVISTSCNTNCISNTSSLLVDWESSISGGSICEKISDYTMAFRPAPSSVAQVKGNNNWSLSPVPANDIVTLSSASGALSTERYTISDVTGRVLTQAAVSEPKQKIDISTFSPGIYFLKVYNNDQYQQVIKFVKD